MTRRSIAATSVSSGVSPGGLIVHEVFGSIVAVNSHNISSVTSEAKSDAADKLLLGEFLESTVGNLIYTFHSGISSKSPARTTLSLILNLVDGTGVNPINASWEVYLSINKII